MVFLLLEFKNDFWKSKKGVKVTSEGSYAKYLTLKWWCSTQCTPRPREKSHHSSFKYKILNLSNVKIPWKWVIVGPGLITPVRLVQECDTWAHHISCCLHQSGVSCMCGRVRKVYLSVSQGSCWSKKQQTCWLRDSWRSSYWVEHVFPERICSSSNIQPLSDKLHCSALQPLKGAVCKKIKHQRQKNLH